MQSGTSLPDIFKSTVSFFKLNWVKVLVLILIFYAPFNIVTSFFPAEGLDAAGEPLLEGSAEGASLSQILKGFAGIVVNVALAFLVLAYAGGENLTVKPAIFRAAPRLPAVFGTLLLATLLLLPLYLALLIPGLIFSVFWLFGVQSAALRGKSFFKALSYSKALVKGRWWKTFGYAAVILLLGSGISLAAISAAAFISTLLTALIPLEVFGRLLNILVLSFVDFAQTLAWAALVFFFLQWEQSRGPETLPAEQGNAQNPAV